MNRGIVMEVQKQSVLVLTSEGEFVKCKKQHREYEIGEEILFPQAEKMEQRSKLLFFFWPKRFAFAASSVLALCLWVFFNSPAEEKAMAYVAVDINPSLEMTVDSELHVINLEAYNEDGRRVLSRLKAWENEPLATVIRTIVRQSQQEGYLQSDKQVTITSVTASGTDGQIEQRIDDVITTVQKTYEKEAVTVVLQKSTIQMREDAKRAGISTGIYMRQEKEKLQQKQEGNGKLEKAPANQQEQPKSQPFQPSAENQREGPLAPNNRSNTAPPQQRKEELVTGEAVNKEKEQEKAVQKEVKKTEKETKQEEKVEQKQEKKQEKKQEQKQVKNQIKEEKAKPSPSKNENGKEEKQNNK